MCPWLLPSSGRPELCQEAIDACTKTKMSTTGFVVIDTKRGDYPDLKVPPNWTIMRSSLYMAETMDLIYKLEPFADFYGLLADDTHPRTDYWDTTLIEMAKPFYLVSCHDGWMSHDPVMRLYSLFGAMVWGGKLVRAVGSWSLIGTHQSGVDDAWVHLICKLLAPLKLNRFCDTVTVEHLQWKTGKRKNDDSDTNTMVEGKEIVKEPFKSDLQKFEQWKTSEDVIKATNNVIGMLLHE